MNNEFNIYIKVFDFGSIVSSVTTHEHNVGSVKRLTFPRQEDSMVCRVYKFAAVYN